MVEICERLKPSVTHKHDVRRTQSKCCHTKYNFKSLSKSVENSKISSTFVLRSPENFLKILTGDYLPLKLETVEASTRQNDVTNAPAIPTPNVTGIPTYYCVPPRPLAHCVVRKCHRRTVPRQNRVSGSLHYHTSVSLNAHIRFTNNFSCQLSVPVAHRGKRGLLGYDP